MKQCYSPLAVTIWQRRFIYTCPYETSASLQRCIITSHLEMCILSDHHESHVPTLYAIKHTVHSGTNNTKRNTFMYNIC